MKAVLKKSVSFLLCLAMLFSCFVFYATEAVAQGETKSVTVADAQSYCVRVLIVEDRDFSFDPATDNEAYQNDELWEDYATVTYKTANGLGEEKTLSFNLGDRDDASKSIGDRYNIVSGSGDDYGYFPSDDGVEIDGFPTSVFCNYQIKNKAKGGFYAYFQIANKVDGQWDWSNYGTCTDRGIGMFGANVGGSISSQYKKSIGGIVGHVSLTAADNPGTGTDINCTITVPNACYPYALENVDGSFDIYNGEAVSDSITCPATSAQSAAQRSILYSSPVDQYGVALVPTISVCGELSTEGISLENNVLSVAYAANLADETDSQALSIEVRWVQKDKTNPEVFATKSVTVEDAQYVVNWYNYSGLVATRKYYFGDVPSQEVPARPYDENVHYLAGAWDHAAQAVTDTSNNEYTAVYTEVAHDYSVYQSYNATEHKRICQVEETEHFILEAHTLTTKDVDPTCTTRGYTAKSCTLCNYYAESDYVKALGHNFDYLHGVEIKEPTCTETGIMSYPCKRCDATDQKPISELEHNYVAHYQTQPLNEQNGSGVYYSCDMCAQFWAAHYNTEGQYLEIADVTAPYATADEALAACDPNISLPAPAFNVFNNTKIGYNYENRGACLKLIHLQVPTYQPLRFMGSVKVPENVSWQVGAAGNAVTDVGYVYSPTVNLSQKDDLEIGKPNVFKMSVLDSNTGIYNGTNWVGISKHESADGVQLTCNLLIDVAFENWKKQISARPYITYRYQGMEFTVYDSEITSRSVEYIASMVVQNPNESQAAIDYCGSVILKNLKNS